MKEKKLIEDEKSEDLEKYLEDFDDKQKKEKD